MLIEGIFITFSGLIAFYLILFGLASIQTKKISVLPSNTRLELIIPAYNEEKVIESCIKSVLDQGKIIKKLIIVVDHSNDNTANICRKIAKSKKNIVLIEKNKGVRSKTRAIIRGLKEVDGPIFAVVDADIILARNALPKLLSVYTQTKANFATAMVAAYDSVSLTSRLIAWDRNFRQFVLQKAKARVGMANFGGSLGIMNVSKYKQLIYDCNLEDYRLTLNVIHKKDKIVFLPEVLAFEQDRSSIRTLFYQRVRWTCGNIHIFTDFVHVFRKLEWIKKTFLLGYPVLWYYLYYFLAASIIVGIAFSNSAILVSYVMVASLLYLELLLSKYVFQGLKVLDFFTSLLFIFIFPLVISFAGLAALTKNPAGKDYRTVLGKTYWER